LDKGYTSNRRFDVGCDSFPPAIFVVDGNLSISGGLQFALRYVVFLEMYEARTRIGFGKDVVFTKQFTVMFILYLPGEEFLQKTHISRQFTFAMLLSLDKDYLFLLR